jgi:hypothetical protein
VWLLLHVANPVRILKTLLFSKSRTIPPSLLHRNYAIPKTAMGIHISSSSTALPAGSYLDHEEDPLAIIDKQSTAETWPEPDTHKSEETKPDPDKPVSLTMNLHLKLLRRLPERDELNEIAGAPLFTELVKEHAKSLATETSTAPFSQYALLAGESDSLQKTPLEDPRIFYNVAAPSSVFICGSQGSGKSHTLSCLLESCLIPSSRFGELPKPLTGIVFHYDTFVSDTAGSPCEAAYLASNSCVKVRVLCAPTNIRVMEVRQKYASLHQY